MVLKAEIVPPYRRRSTVIMRLVPRALECGASPGYVVEFLSHGGVLVSPFQGRVRQSQRVLVGDVAETISMSMRRFSGAGPEAPPSRHRGAREGRGVRPVELRASL